MMRLVEWVAPRTGADAVLKALAFLTLINGLNWIVTVLVLAVPYRLGADLLSTTAVAAPFVVLIVAVLMHQRRLQHRLTLLATTDALTGLPNRRAFLARTTAATAGGRAGALLLLDADHFKQINDRWGHAVGDACLSAIGERLRASLRPGDIVGRIGGEEFSIFLPGATREQAEALGARLCEAIGVEALGAEEALGVTLSIGAALGAPGTPLDRLMARADRALYRAKAEGRARVVFCSEAGT